MRKIGQTHRRLVANKSYLEERGRPKTPSDLKKHDCIVYTGLATLDTWTFERSPGSAETVTVSGPVSVSASEGVRAAVLEGFGIALCPTWLFRNEIEDGHLVTLLEDYESSPLPIHAVMPTRRLITPRVRAFVEFVANEFRKDPLLKFANEP